MPYLTVRQSGQQLQDLPKILFRALLKVVEMFIHVVQTLIYALETSSITVQNVIHALKTVIHVFQALITPFSRSRNESKLIFIL